MTPAPISVERLLYLAHEIQFFWDEDWLDELAEALPALLHQLAELQAENCTLESHLAAALNEVAASDKQIEAAERAREEAERDLRAIYEAVPGLPIYATEEDADRATDAFTAICHLCNEYIASDAAYLAASGGANEDR